MSRIPNKIEKPKSEGWLGKYKHNQFHNYQLSEYNSAISYVKKFRTAIDLGGNLGIMSSRMVVDFEFVHSFEPLFYDYLIKNVPADNIKVYPYAVGNEVKSEVMRVGHYHSGGSNIVKKKEKNESYKTVDVVTVDSYNITDVDFIKIDVEGYEWFAIQGASETIRTYQPVLLVELKETNKYYTEINNFFNDLGYSKKTAGEMDTVFYKK